MAKDRPKFLNLLQIRLPVTGVVSILHRMSGVLLILGLPVLIYLLERSLLDNAGFNEVRRLVREPLMSMVLLALLWGLFHHLIAGIRFLLIDMDIGMSLRGARGSAWFTLAADLVVVAFLIGWLI